MFWFAPFLNGTVSITATTCPSRHPHTFALHSPVCAIPLPHWDHWAFLHSNLLCQAFPTTMAFSWQPSLLPGACLYLARATLAILPVRGSTVAWRSSSGSWTISTPCHH